MKGRSSTSKSDIKERQTERTTIKISQTDRQTDKQTESTFHVMVSQLSCFRVASYHIRLAGPALPFPYFDFPSITFLFLSVAPASWLPGNLSVFLSSFPLRCFFISALLPSLLRLNERGRRESERQGRERKPD